MFILLFMYIYIYTPFSSTSFPKSCPKKKKKTGTFSPDLRRELWEELTGRDQEVVDFDHFLAALRGVRVTQTTVPPVKKPDGPDTTGSTGATAMPLPISRRQHGAALSMGLPIKARNLDLLIR